MGGLSKKASLLTQLSQANSTGVLKVDAGTLLFDDKLALQPQRQSQATITASAIVAALNHMEYDAVAIGRQDLSAGLASLQKLASEASFPFLSANLVNHQGELLFKPYAEIERAGIRIAIIGMTGHTSLPETCTGEVKALPWQESLPKTLETVSPNNDLIILLSNLSAADNHQVAKQYSNVHLIIQSGVSKQNLRPQLRNNSVIVQGGHDGKYQGKLTVNWSSSQKWQQKKNVVLALRKEYDRLGWLIGRVQKKGGPDVVYKDNKPARLAFGKKIARYEELELEISKKIAEEKNTVNEQATHTNQFHPLPPSVVDDPAITKLLQDYRRKANQVRRQKAETRKLSKYIGSKKCQSCHEEIFTAWSKTPHASSYDTLKERDQNNNQTCVYCHVTGLTEGSAYLADSLPSHLKEVGCEVCHGPGERHADNPNIKLSAQPLRPTLCLQCHTPERDDHFNFPQDKEKVH